MEIAYSYFASILAAPKISAMFKIWEDSWVLLISTSLDACVQH
jgi:hypothetical protein